MDFQDHFEIDPRHKILVCSKCQYAIVPSQLATHIQVYHRHLSIQQRHDFVSRVATSSDLAHVHEDVIYPDPTDAPINSLPVYFDGLRCQWASDLSACTYVCRTLRLMREHCKQKHGWVNQQKRGGDTRAKQLHTANKMWAPNRACQRFFKVTTWQKYFEVAAIRPSANKKHIENQKHLFFQAQREDVKKTASDLAEAANVVQGFDNHRSTVVPWLRETGIVKHIAQLKKDEIKAAIALPSSEGESELRKIVDAMESLLREAHSLCFDGTECMLTWPCRVVLSRFQSSQVEMVGKTRAFDPYKEPGTLKSYFGISQRFLSYFHRVVFPDEYYFDIEDTDEQVKRPEDVVEATDEQLAAWNDIWQIAKQECQSEDGEEKKQTELKRRLLEMWMLIVGHNTGARRYQSPLLSFCAMLSIKPSTKGWLEPGNFNSHLSAMIWVVQLLIFYDSARKEQQGRGQTLQLVKRFCGRYLQQTMETPMGEVLRWRLTLHQILQQRKVYAPAIFITAKKYNLPVHQIRHPGLCAFVNSEAVATRQAILRKTARRVYVAIFVLGLPREHFIFDIARMSRMDVGMIGEEFDSLPQVDAEGQMRAALSKLKDHCGLLEPLDAQTTFRIIMEVDEDSTPGIDNGPRGKDIPDPSQNGRCCIKEHATKMEHAQTTPQLSAYTSSQPLGSDGAPSSSTNVYGTPLTQKEFDD